MGMNKIKYDKRDRKLFLTLAIITTVILLACLILMNTDLPEELEASVIGVMIVVCFTVFPVLALASWVKFADSHTYLKRLEKYGYTVPANKKEYDNSLEKLATGELKTFEQPSKESKVLAVLSWVVSVAMVVYAIFLSIRFSHMLENVAFFIIVTIAIAIFWLVFGFGFWKQRLRDQLRDDVEFNSSLKPRKHLVEGITTIIILTAISVVIAVNMYTMSKYVERSYENPEEIVTIEIIPKEIEGFLFLTKVLYNISEPF